MKNLSSKDVVKDILNKSGFKFSKSLGQNFLIDDSVLDSIVYGAELSDEDYVLEIGPGFGTLTQKLCKNAKKVVAVEIDKTAIPILEDNLKEFDNIKIINDDVLKLDLKKLCDEEFEGKSFKVVANLPYYITTPIVMALLENSLNISMLVVMVQKEVAQRFSAKPNKKDYGAITLSVDYYCDTEMVCDVPPHCFMPPPKVTSAVIKFIVRNEKKVSPKDEKLFFNIIKAAFGMRRKTLLNALSNSGCINLTKEEICNVLEECSVDPKRRGETLDIFEFCTLSDKFFEKIQKK